MRLLNRHRSYCSQPHASRTSLQVAPRHRTLDLVCSDGTRSCFAGFLPFSAIYIELYYIFASVWGHKVYTIYSILFIVFIILVIVTAFITIALTYFQLAVEDHRWWWRSFMCGGSTGQYSVYSSLLAFVHGSAGFLFAAVSVFVCITCSGTRSCLHSMQIDQVSLAAASSLHSSRVVPCCPKDMFTRFASVRNGTVGQSCSLLHTGTAGIWL